MAAVMASVKAQPGRRLGDIATFLHLHRHTITHIVFDSTGLTFRAWRDSLRRDIAAELLRHSSMSIKEITYLLGFATTRSFDKFTKRVLGSTPTTYRRTFDPHGQ
jgi:AraC-like DNA-binding protein